MGIKIRYTASATAGASFTYSIERREDEKFFDFDRGVFRPYKDIPGAAIAGRMTYHGGAMVAEFNHGKAGVAYVIRIHAGPGGQVVAELPVIANADDKQVLVSKGVQHVQPSFRSGKKFHDGRVIEARYRLTFYGDDGFTVHTATLWKDGTSSCNCPRWIKQIKGEERRCAHSQHALNLTANVDLTSEQPEPPPPEPPKGPVPFKRRSRPVDT